MASEKAGNAFDRMRRSAEGRTTIIGVDRLDYSKGLEERFLGYRRFLEDNEARRGELFLLQIAPPSRGEVATSPREGGAICNMNTWPRRFSS